MSMDKKRAQFYLIGAVIIILVIVSIVAITNYTSTKKEPSNIYDITQIMEWENLQSVQQAEYTKTATSKETTADFLEMFSDYLKDNINEDFNLVIIYGDVSSGNVSGNVYTRESLGMVNTDIFDLSTSTQGASDVTARNAQIQVNPDGKTVDVTIISAGAANITQTLPILSDNNFMFVMTTSSGFNRYVQTNLNRTRI